MIYSTLQEYTCIMVFTAKKTDPKNKKTQFAYWKGDGFEKAKNGGRLDVNNTWERRKWAKEDLEQTSIPLPTRNNKPDFVYMENYIKTLKYSNSLNKQRVP